MSSSRIAGLVGIGVTSLVVAATIFGSFYRVDQTERGVLFRNGAFIRVEEPGLHFKLPWLESVVLVGTYQRTTRWDHSTGQDYRQEAYSQDQQPAKMSLSVLWHIPPGSVEMLYSKYRSPDGVELGLINRRVPPDIKTVFGRFSAVSSIQDRAKLNAEILQSVLNDLEVKDAPIVIDGVQLEDIEFSSAYIQSVEGAMQARVEVQRLEQKQQQEDVSARITVIKAKAAADAQVAEATAQAQAVRLRGEADASAIRAKGDALKDNPALVELTRAERWNGVLPTTMVPGSAVPFINVK